MALDTAVVKLAIALADAAGAAIRPFYRADFVHEAKGDMSPVTEADRAAEAAMRAIIEQNFPYDGIIGEEYGVKPGKNGRAWVLDPIDGTVSFMAGRPIFGTLIALLQDGFPVLGVIDQCISGERWIGQVGEVTTLNGKPVTTRRCRTLAEATLASSGPQYFDDHSAEHFMALAAKTSHKTMVWGGDCYNYGLLAAGQIDLVVEAGLKAYDIAAHIPIIEGAGGLVCDWAGEPLHFDASDDQKLHNVIALGDSARLDDVVEALACHH